MSRFSKLLSEYFPRGRLRRCFRGHLLVWFSACSPEVNTFAFKIEFCGFNFVNRRQKCDDTKTFLLCTTIDFSWWSVGDRKWDQKNWKRRWLEIHHICMKITTFRATQSASSGEKFGQKHITFGNYFKVLKSRSKSLDANHRHVETEKHVWSKL